MAQKIIKAENAQKKVQPQKKKEKKVSLDAQERLAEILNDSPRLISLQGTEWEVRALRMGTQFLIAQKAIKIAKLEQANFGDVVKQFAVNIPAVIEVLTLALLNDKNKIFTDGNEKNGYSEQYQSVYDTLMWECDVNNFAEIFLDVLQMIDVSFFLESCRIIEMFRESTMTRKTKTPEQE